MPSTKDATMTLRLKGIQSVNQLYVLLKLFPNGNWDYPELSSNPNITWEIVQELSDEPWCYNSLSENPNITWEIVKNNLDKPWSFSRLSLNPNITWDIVQDNPNYPWNYAWLSSNPNITWDIVQDNLDKNWSFPELSENPNITWEIINTHPNISWCFYRVNFNPNITWDIVQENPDILWNYNDLSENPNITGEIIMNNMDRKWNYDIIVSKLPFEFIKDNEVFTYNLSFLYCNNTITVETIRENPDFEWPLNIWINENISWNDYLSFNIDNINILRNPNITAWNIVNTIKEGKRRRTISAFSEDNIYRKISQNEFNRTPSIIIKRLQRKYFDRWKAKVWLIVSTRNYYRDIYFQSIHLIRLKYEDITLRNVTNKSPKFIFPKKIFNMSDDNLD